MGTSKNALDAFEQRLKDSLEQFEVPYNSSDWNQLERTLNGERRGWWMSGVGLGLLITGTLVVGGAAWYGLTSADLKNGLVEQGTPSVELTANGSDAQQDLGADKKVLDTDAASQVVSEENDGKAAEVATDAANKVVVEARTADRPVATKGSGTTGHPVSVRGSDRSAAAPAVPPAKEAATPKAGSTFTASVAEGCPGTAVDFKVSNMPEDGIYLWNFGDGSFSNRANPEHTFTKPGEYQVTLSMSRPGAGIIQNKPSSDRIVIHEAPKASFNVLKQEYEGHLPSVHFENRSLAGAEYHWDFGDGETSTIAHPDHIYKKKGTYQAELTVTNAIGCVDKFMKEVRIDKDYNLDAPAAFSPNGDGSEEVFMPEALRTSGVKFHLAVYDPSGAPVYETNDANKPWQGKLNNRGDVLPAGEYVWVVDVRESLHLAETYTGKVKLVR